MENESPDPEDPEIAALLGFTPVERKCERQGGWSAEHQRIYIAGLARTGNVEQAADAVGLTGNGAYQLRRKPGAAAFKAAWDAALALHRLRRKPVARAGRPPEPAATTDEEERAELFDALIAMYWTKVKAERRCRLEGRIVEADFYVRQLTCIEIGCDLAGNAAALLAGLKRGGVALHNAAATPLSLYFDTLRRRHWAEAGEPDRPALPRFGEVRDGIAALPRTDYNIVREGMPYDAWRRRQDIDAAVAAEAQRLWEEKARADAAAWASRAEGGAAVGVPRRPC